MAESKPLRLVIVTPERTVLEQEVETASIPAMDGEVGIMNGRSPLVARLAPGAVRFTSAGQPHWLYVDGGFGQVTDNVVTVLTPRTKQPNELSVEDAHKDLADAKGMVPTTSEAFAERDFKIARGYAQKRLAAKKSS